jgi:hypothetical protein
VVVTPRAQPDVGAKDIRPEVDRHAAVKENDWMCDVEFQVSLVVTRHWWWTTLPMRPHAVTVCKLPVFHYVVSYSLFAQCSRLDHTMTMASWNQSGVRMGLTSTVNWNRGQAPFREFGASQLLLAKRCSTLYNGMGWLNCESFFEDSLSGQQ